MSYVDPGIARRTRLQRITYSFVRAVLTAFVKVFWRPTINGVEHIPAEGGFIVAPVHRSNIDTFPMVGMTRRRMSFLGKDSLWKNKVGAFFFDAMGGYPVHRGTADREALRRCIEVVSRGEGLVLFPEGTRQSGPKVCDLFEGAAYVASKANVPIIPIGIGGTEAAMPKGSKMIHPVKLHYEIGPPIPAPVGEDGGRASREQLHATTKALHEELQRVFDIARAKAGVKD
ncbi:MAG TPA: lysophospholipid acyltransferase family protein [Acidimicrobiales bacterium]|nr:lysophospholipid acyltransferase family protein [Acidimicrobiales bacterium]